MIKLVASDLDGTIIDQNNNIYTNNFKAINDIKNKNIDFVICTGKTYPIMHKTCAKINASYGIFGNGNQIIDLKNGKQIYQKLLSQDELLSCIKIANKQNLHVHLYTDTEIITEQLLYMDLRNYELQKEKFYDASLQITIVDSISDYIKFTNPNVCKLIISSSKALNKTKSEIEDTLNLSVTTIRKYGKFKDTIINKEYEYLDITPKGINKNTALDILGTYLNISKDEMLTIGDNLNDLDMVKNAGIGVAVNNAYDELKNVAKYTTINPVDKGGFAEAIYKFIEF